MQLSRRADYAIRAVVDLASLPEGSIGITREIADRQEIPPVFLAKIIGRLAKAGLIRAYRGASGGVTLARPAEELTLLDVVEAIEGPLTLNRCLARAGECPREVFCPVKGIWAEAQERLVAQLKDANVAAVVRRGQELQRRPTTPVR